MTTLVCGNYYSDEDAQSLWDDGVKGQEMEELLMKYSMLHLTREQIKSLNASQKIEYVKQSIEAEIECFADDSSIHPMQIYSNISANEWDYIEYLLHN